MTEAGQRLLIVRLSSIGDIVHALPAAAALAESLPAARVDWVVEKRFAVLLEANPHLHRVIALDTLGWRRRLASASAWREIREGIRQLRCIGYDAALDFQGLWKSSVVAWLSRAPKRVGFAAGRLREPGAGLLYTDRVSPPPQVHVVKENLVLVESLGAKAAKWQFPLPQNTGDNDYVAARLRELTSDRVIIVNPGGGWRAKCWAPENYATLVRQIAGSRQEALVLTGAPAEEPMIREIIRASGMPRVTYLPTSIVQFIALVRRAQLFIGGDTGPLHLAAAVGTPVVGIYGPTDPTRNGPFSPDDIALHNHQAINHTRREDHPAYIGGIPVATVLQAVEQRLARTYG